jgi:hypothetical protein
MSKIVKIVLLAGVSIIALACFFLVIWSLTNPVPVNPSVVSEPQWDSPRTRQLFWRACADCHSNETVWPWYTRMPVVGQLVRFDVFEGRGRFNVSEWGQRRNESHEAAEVLLEGEMPPGQYLLLHPTAQLNNVEKQELADGMTKSFGR